MVDSDSKRKIKVNFEGGDGSSRENAIVIKGAPHNHYAVIMVYDYMEKAFGQREVDWKLARQRSLSSEGKQYSVLEIILKNGERRNICFDITESFINAKKL